MAETQKQLVAGRVDFSMEGGTMLAYFTGHASYSDIKRMHARLLNETNQKSIASLTVIRTPAELSPRGRDALVEMLKQADGRITAWAVVIEGEGLIASILRTFASTIRLKAHVKFPFRLFASVAPAAAWIVEQTGTDGAMLSRALIALRSSGVTMASQILDK